MKNALLLSAALLPAHAGAQEGLNLFEQLNAKALEFTPINAEGKKECMGEPTGKMSCKDVLKEGNIRITLYSANYAEFAGVDVENLARQYERNFFCDYDVENRTLEIASCGTSSRTLREDQAADGINPEYIQEILWRSYKLNGF